MACEDVDGPWCINHALGGGCGFDVSTVEKVVGITGCENCTSDVIDAAAGGVEYRLHEFGVMYPSHAFSYWPGFSLNPALWDLRRLDDGYRRKYGEPFRFNPADIRHVHHMRRFYILTSSRGRLRLRLRPNVLWGSVRHRFFISLPKWNMLLCSIKLVLSGECSDFTPGSFALVYFLRGDRLSVFVSLCLILQHFSSLLSRLVHGRAANT